MMQGGYYQQQPGMMNGMNGMGQMGQMGMNGMGQMGMNPMMAQMGQGGMMMPGQQGMMGGGMMNGMGMNPMMQGGMGMGMQGMAGGHMQAMPGMGGQGMMQGMNMPGMMQGGGMVPGAGLGMLGGNAWRNLDYNYSLPQLGYKPDATWSPWDLATRAYTGERLERGFFDNIISSLSNFFSNRHLSEEAARNAHRRVYHLGEGEDSGSKSLGGAAAYQAFLHWDRDHQSLYHSFPTSENRERLVALAVAELFRLWDSVQPRSSRASIEDAAQYAAATAKYLFDRHYDMQGQHGHHGHGSMSGRGGRHAGYGADDESDGESEGRGRGHRRSMYGQPGYNGQMMSGQGMMGMSPGMMNGQQGMMQPGMMQGMGGMMQGGPGGVNMNPMMMPGSMLPQGMHGQMGEAQAVPGMHPYSYGPSGGVAMGNQPIDQMGDPTFPGGPGRATYGYGQPRYY